MGQKMSTELKPCPFCGGKAHIVSETLLDEIGRFYSVKCSKCGAKSGEKFANDTCPLFFEEVREQWNRRPLEQQLIEALKEAGDVLECYHKNTGIDLGSASRMPFYADTINKIDEALRKAGV